MHTRTFVLWRPRDFWISAAVVHGATLVFWLLILLTSNGSVALLALMPLLCFWLFMGPPSRRARWLSATVGGRALIVRNRHGEKRRLAFSDVTRARFTASTATLTARDGAQLRIHARYGEAGVLEAVHLHLQDGTETGECTCLTLGSWRAVGIVALGGVLLAAARVRLLAGTAGGWQGGSDSLAWRAGLAVVMGLVAAAMLLVAALDGGALANRRPTGVQKIDWEAHPPSLRDHVLAGAASPWWGLDLEFRPREPAWAGLGWRRVVTAALATGVLVTVFSAISGMSVPTSIALGACMSLTPLVLPLFILAPQRLERWTNGLRVVFECDRWYVVDDESGRRTDAEIMTTRHGTGLLAEVRGRSRDLVTSEFLLVSQRTGATVYAGTGR